MSTNVAIINETLPAANLAPLPLVVAIGSVTGRRGGPRE